MQFERFRMPIGRFMAVVALFGITLAIARLNRSLGVFVGVLSCLTYRRASGEIDVARENGERVDPTLKLALFLKVMVTVLVMAVVSILSLLLLLIPGLVIMWVVELIGGESCTSLLLFDHPPKYPTSLWSFIRTVAGILVYTVLMMAWLVVFVMVAVQLYVDWACYLMEPREERRILGALSSPNTPSPVPPTEAPPS